MRSGKIRLFVAALLALLFSLAVVAPSRADVVLGFPNGLTGWSIYGDPPGMAGSTGTVTASGGLATIFESTFVSETDLYMSFTVPTGAHSLQFTLNSISPDSGYENGVTPDSFGASFGVITPDPTGVNPPVVTSLVPTVDSTTDSFYTMDVVTNPNPALTAPGVTVTSLAGTLGVISVDLSGLGLDGQSAGVLFRLIGGTNGLNSSTVTVSNVEIITGSAVPEPTSIVTGLTAVVVVGAGLGARSRRRLKQGTA
jgi:hypothetical protein